MTEEQFPDVLRHAARHYNTPPATPREAMWARIEAERRAQKGQSRKVIFLPWVWGAGIAAVLALGIGLGRVSMTSESEPAAVVAASAPAAGSAVAPRAGTPTPQTTAPTAYQVAATDHLSRAEALLTSFRAQAAKGQADAQVAAWAGDLLSNTRLLLDSPAAQDPQLRLLLQDLELVLAQINQLPARRSGEEVEIIERSLDHGDMLPRLRTAVPAGPPTTQT